MTFLGFVVHAKLHQFLIMSRPWKSPHWEIRIILSISIGPLTSRCSGPNENQIGPSTEPCGTLWLTLVRTDDSSLICTNWNRSEKHDLNQFRAVPLMLINCSSLCNKIWWSLVLNAALRSNRTRTDTNPWSEAIRRSLVTFAKAVSVLWLALNPDWKSSYTLLSWNNSHSWLATTFRGFQTGRGGWISVCSWLNLWV